VASFGSHSAYPVHVAFSPDGTLFATGEMDGLINLLDVSSRKPRPIGRGYRNALHDLTFSRDGRRLVAAGDSPDGLVKFWDVATGRDVATLPGKPGWYSHIGFSPDGNTLFAVGFDGTALFWRAPALAEIQATESSAAAAQRNR
jgi:WD40 repeat protein